MIEAVRATKKFGRKTVLRNLSMTAEKGQITCLIGINGAGKSTLLKAIMGLTPLSGGQIRIDGAPIGKAVYEKVAFVPDTLPMPPSMTVADSLQFMGDYYSNWNAKRASDLLVFFRLNVSDRISSLSKGNAAKLNLLHGLSLDTDYVLMDEPFSGIDLFSREQIASVFTSDLIEGRGVILTTHEIGEIEHLIDKAVLLDQGEVRREFMCEEMRMAEGKSVIDVMREVYRA
ncbi:ATP-binding cassette domain-containing protein [Cohnella sp. CFH 77786]|uniref:ABC transporter ATP-binding protein n=1 Tax=Cohnella sp. CFH 77786 TaxID=2662265 RepID=UPI001C60D9C7|nr:ABC transporter ATP-binding protein [Cohnella sp. CFH 77786]MBW5444928.1 ATP-binding cassette domain-containing protein [Cohnella sp. CFH 77786]